MPKRPLILLPDIVLSAAGLWLPRGAADGDGPDPPRFHAQQTAGGFAVVSRQAPDPMEVLFSALPVESDFDLSTSTLSDLRDKVRLLPFDTAALFYARLTAHAWHAGTDPDKQIAIAREIFPPTAGAIPAIERFLKTHRRGAVFVEQQLFALLRLAIESSPPGVFNESDSRAFFDPALRSLFGALTVVSESISELPGGDDDRQKWLAVLIQNGGYNAKTPPMHAFSRAMRLLELSRDGSVGAPQDRCDITTWLQDDYKLTPTRQFAMGFTFAGLAKAFDEESRSADISLLAAQRVDDLLGQLGLADRKQAALDLISAPREWFAERFALAEPTVMDIAWRRAPFEQKPFLRWGDGHLLLVSPRAVLSWLGEGFQHRVFACAERRGEQVKHRWMRYFGQLVEEYALRLTQSVYPSGPLQQRVHGEQTYGRNNSKKTSDIAVDAGPDLVLFEVGAGRLKESSRVSAEWDDVKADIAKLVLVRMKKLHGSIDAILSGDATIPGVDRTEVRRVWPVVVTAGGMVQSELLWDYIRDNAGDTLTQSRAQPLTLLDLDDFELLLGAVEGGDTLVDLLERKTSSPYREFDFSQWLENDPTAPARRRPQVLDDHMDSVFSAVADVLGFDAAAIEARKAERGLA